MLVPVKDLLKSLLRRPIRQTQAYLLRSTAAPFVHSRPLERPTAAVSTGDPEGRRAPGRILVIDLTLPMPDRDAGSRTVFEHLICLVELGFEVHFWPWDGIDVPRYTHALRRLGIAVHAGYLRPTLRSHLADPRNRHDHVLVNRPDVADTYLDVLSKSAASIVYYGHDLHFARMEMEARESGSPDKARAAAEMLGIERRIWRSVHVATYPTEDEVRQVRLLEPEVITLPLQAFCYDDFTDRHDVPADRKIMFVGNFRHTPNVSAAERLAGEIFPLVREQVADARLVIAGAYVSDRIRSLAGNGVEIAGWLSVEDMDALYRSSRVAAVPLSFGAGIKLKVVEAMAKGVPLVVSPVGAQGLSELESVVPVRETPADFADAIVEILRCDDESWRHRSADELNYVRSRYSRDSMKSSLLRALEGADTKN